MKQLLPKTAIALCCGLLSGLAGAREPARDQVSLASPDGAIEMTVTAGASLTYSVAVDKVKVLAESRLGLRFRDGFTLGPNTRIVKIEKSAVETSWENRFGKRRHVTDRHNELRLSLVSASSKPGEPERAFALVIRAFNDGLGFRYDLPAPAAGPQEFVLEEELTQFTFPDNYTCYAGINENTGTSQNPIGFLGSQESEYKPVPAASLPTDQVRMTPLLAKAPGAWLLLTESDLYDWAGMWLNRVPDVPGAQGVTLAARLAPRLDGQGLVKSAFPRRSPWRVLVLARDPRQLIESDLVLNLATPCVLKDIAYVKPGIASWDWWPQVTRPGTETYQELVQFASDMGWAYTLLDAGWSSRAGILQTSRAVDMPATLAFAKEKNVRLWLWLYWSSLEPTNACEEAFALYEKWGVAGVKIDFMNRDDQDMVNWYEKIAKCADQHHLMVNFHGAFKPTGMNRTYPNQITREGILGNEYNRWSNRVTAEHKTTLPFVRLVAGPGDFTPGGFLNRQGEEFKFNVKPTLVQGTRCAELALFVCLESPVVHACDHPSHYRNQPGLDFLKIVPTVWDETRALDGAVGEHLAIARRNGERWFLGVLNNSAARDLPLKLDFLGPGAWNLKLWKDAPDSDKNGEHLVEEQQSVTSAGQLSLHLAGSGGAVGCFEIQK